MENLGGIIVISIYALLTCFVLIRKGRDNVSSQIKSNAKLHFERFNEALSKFNSQVAIYLDNEINNKGKEIDKDRHLLLLELRKNMAPTISGRYRFFEDIDMTSEKEVKIHTCHICNKITFGMNFVVRHYISTTSGQSVSSYTNYHVVCANCIGHDVLRISDIGSYRTYKIDTLRSFIQDTPQLHATHQDLINVCKSINNK